MEQSARQGYRLIAFATGYPSLPTNAGAEVLTR
jgi:hypothetical protein